MRSHGIHIATIAVTAVTLCGAIVAAISQQPSWQQASTHFSVVAALGVVIASLWNHRVPRYDPWWIVVIGYGISTLFSALSIATVGPFETPPELIRQGFVYAFIVRLLAYALKANQWMSRMHVARWIDVLVMTTSSLLIFSTLAYEPVVTGSLSSSGMQTVITMMAVSSAMIWALALFAFSPAIKLIAVNVLIAAALFAYATQMLTVASLNPNITVPPELFSIQLFAIPTMMAAFCLPGIATQPGDQAADTAVLGKRQAVGLAACMFTPWVALALSGIYGKLVAWPVIAAGGVIITLLSMIRLGVMFFEVQRSRGELVQLVRHDSLTGAASRREWDRTLLQQSRVDVVPNTRWVALIDLDFFKLFNDKHGHQAGDAFLQDVAETWKHVLEPGDMLARYGGEEFALLLFRSQEHEVVETLQRIRRSVPGNETCSVGAAPWDSNITSERAVNLADQALYESKAAGRDQVRLATPSTLRQIKVAAEASV